MRVVSEWNWLFNVTCNDISVIYVMARRCAGGLKKLDLRSGSQRHRQFVGFFNMSVKGDWNGVVYRNNRKRVIPCRCLAFKINYQLLFKNGKKSVLDPVTQGITLNLNKILMSRETGIETIWISCYICLFGCCISEKLAVTLVKLKAQGPCTGHRSIIATLHCFPLHEKYTN